jgi:ABC-type branched-subunit amino acid transport system permease subunit
MNPYGPSSHYRPLWIAIPTLIVLPFVVHVLGLSVNSASIIVILAIATIGLNLCVGYTGLVSFGHSTWFGIGAYAAALIQLDWFPNQIILPILLSTIVVAVGATFVGVLILRRRGVYFSLLTLALAALTYTVCFRWSAVTGGEDGLGGLKRGSIGPFSLDNTMTYYVFVAMIGLALLYAVLRLTRSPFGGIGLGAVFRRTAGDGRDRWHAQHSRAGGRRAIL